LAGNSAKEGPGAEVENQQHDDKYDKQHDTDDGKSKKSETAHGGLLLGDRLLLIGDGLLLVGYRLAGELDLLLLQIAHFFEDLCDLFITHAWSSVRGMVARAEQLSHQPERSDKNVDRIGEEGRLVALDQVAKPG